MMNWINGRKFRNGCTTLTTDKIDKFTKEGFWFNKTFPEYLDYWAYWESQRPAIYFGDATITYGELKKIVDAIALGLLDLGLGSGDTLACQFPNRPEYLYFQYACFRIGVIFVPILPGLRHSEVEYMLTASEADAFVIVDEWRGFNYVPMAKDLLIKLSKKVHIIVVGDSVPSDCVAYADLLEKGKKLQEKHPDDYLIQFRPDPNEVCLIGFTSGTESLPKGVLSTHNIFVAQMNSYPRRTIHQHDVVFGPNPLPHLFGSLNTAGPIMKGATTVVADFDPNNTSAIIEKYKVTLLGWAPPHFLYSFESPEFTKHDVSSVRIAAVAAAPISPILLNRMRENLPNMRIIHGWGQTENAFATGTHPDDVDELILETDGFAEYGNEIKVCDIDGNELPMGEIGDLYYRGADLMIGFLNDTERTMSSHLSDGFYKTGDLAVMRIASGRLYQTQYGRSKDVISRGGEQISAKEVEELMDSHPKVVAAQVVAMPDPNLQERACVFVVTRKGESDITFDEMKDFILGKNVAKFKIPERLEIVKQFPVTLTGKVRKYELREIIAKKLLDENAIAEDDFNRFTKKKLK